MWPTGAHPSSATPLHWPGTGHGSRGVRRHRGSGRRIQNPDRESRQSYGLFPTHPTARPGAKSRTPGVPNTRIMRQLGAALTPHGFPATMYTPHAHNALSLRTRCCNPRLGTAIRELSGILRGERPDGYRAVVLHPDATISAPSIPPYVRRCRHSRDLYSRALRREPSRGQGLAFAQFL
jgi:hypothetical protein